MKSAGLSEHGFTLLEVLITIVILAFGLLGLANLQAKLHMTEMEAYQRAQAVVLMQDFGSRLQSAGYQSAHDNYLIDTGDPLGVGDDYADTLTLMDCTVDADYPEAWDKDRCQWSVMLKGASEKKGTASVGAMIGGRGCVEELQAPNDAAGVCTPGIYRVTVAWQGLYATTAPILACGSGQYGAEEAFRRVISTTVTIGMPKCIPPT